MALIPTKEKLGPLAQLVSRPQYQPAQDFTGEAMAGAGRALQSVGNDAFAVAEQQAAEADQQRRFMTTQGVGQLDIQADNDLLEADRNAPENGAGLTKTSLAAWDKRAAALVAQTPEYLRPKLEPLLATKRLAFEQKANVQETQRRDGWYRTGISQSQSRAQNRVYNDPAQFDAARDEVLANIRTSGLSQPEKDKLERETLISIGEAKFLRERLVNPGAVKTVLGVAPPDTVEGRGSLLQRGQRIASYYQGRSIGDQPLSAVASAGIAGALMQENSGNFTGKPGDGGKSHGAAQWNGERFEGLKRYAADNGTDWTDPPTQLNYILHEMENGDEGAKRAGRELLAARTPEQAATAMMHFERPTDYTPDNPTAGHGYRSRLRYTRMVLGEDVPAPAPGEAPSLTPRADLPITGTGGRTIDLDGVQPLVLDRFETLQNAWGRLLPVNSGYRDPEKNAAVGGARGSQHIHGNALDVDVSRLSEDERKQLIGMASAAGFTGIGVYNNALHLDTGPRRVWGPNYHSDSVPAWAQGATQAHLNGTPDAAADGKPLTSPGYTMDPAYAAIPFERRMQMLAEAQKADDELTRNTLAQQKATNDALEASFTKRALYGDVTEQEVLNSSLPDASQVSVIRSIRAGQKERSEADQAADALLSGSMGVVNPRDTNAMGALNKAYNTVLETRLKDVPDDQRAEVQQAFTIATIRQTQAIPQKVQATIEAGVLDTSDPAQLSSNLAAASAIQDQVPAAFKQLDEGARKAVADFRYQTMELGRSAEQATAKILASREPDAKVAEELYGPVADKAIREEVIKVSDVTAAFDPGMFSREPGAGAEVTDQNRLMREYRDAFRGAMLETQGDVNRSKAVALAQLRTTWGISNVSGSAQLMRLPPENFYPQINGGYSYIRDDVVKQATDWLNGGEETKPQGKAVPQAKRDVPPDQLRPFTSQEYRANPDGSFSTEVTVTVQDAAGKWMNVPSLWNSNAGWVDLGDNEDAAADIASRYEKRTGKPFPRFDSLPAAEKAASERSSAGGTQNGALAGSSGGVKKRALTSVSLVADEGTARQANNNIRKPSYLMVIETPDENGDGEPERFAAPFRWAMPDEMLAPMLAKKKQEEAAAFQERNQDLINLRTPGNGIRDVLMQAPPEAPPAPTRAPFNRAVPSYPQSKNTTPERLRRIITPPQDESAASFIDPSVSNLGVGGRRPARTRSETTIPTKGERN